MFVNQRLFTLRDKSPGGEPLLPIVYFLPLKVESATKTVPTNLIQFSHSVPSNLCDTMDYTMPGLPVHHQLPEFTQTHVHRVGDAIQPSHPLSSPSPPSPNSSQHQSFPMSQLFTRGGQSIGVSALALVLPKKSQD